MQPPTAASKASSPWAYSHVTCKPACRSQPRISSPLLEAAPAARPLAGVAVQLRAGAAAEPPVPRAGVAAEPRVQRAAGVAELRVPPEAGVTAPYARQVAAFAPRAAGVLPEAVAGSPLGEPVAAAPEAAAAC